MYIMEIKTTNERLIECCKILGISTNATLDEIKKAYRTMSKKYHPDVDKEAVDKEMFKEVPAAYNFLKDNYDLLRYVDSSETPNDNVPEARKFLYYYNSRTMPKHWNGYPVFEDIFIDIETRERISYYSSGAWEEMVLEGYECYSPDPNEYEISYDIIWRKYYKSVDTISIKPVSASFDDVHNRYVQKKKEGKSRDIIIQEMKLEYNEPEKGKHLEKIAPSN